MALNNDIPKAEIEQARGRVLSIQCKLYRWARADREKNFDDLFNFVHDRAMLTVAWDCVRRRRGSRTAGIDGKNRWYVENYLGVRRFLADIRSALKSRTYSPQPVRERGIPKKGGKTRYLGIPTIRDRVVQMALKLVIEPIFEVDFCPMSFGYRPARRTQDAIAEIAHFINPPSSYEYVIEGDIKACFDTVNHTVLMALLRKRIGDRKVLALFKAFLKAGVMKEAGQLAATLSGTPQGGIVSPILANIYLSVLDRHFERAWQNQTHYSGGTTRYRKCGHATYRMIRYADDFVILVRGNREQAAAIRDEAAQIIGDELRMELSAAKTLITHVDDGFDFLGHHVRRVPWKGKRVAWTYPSKKSLEAVKYKVKSLTNASTTHLSLKVLLMRINPVLRGWATYFRYDASKRTFGYVDHFTWWRIIRWFRKKHPTRTWRYLQKRYSVDGWKIQDDGIELFRTVKVKVERYRYRGQRILLPWMDTEELGKVGRYAKYGFDERSFLDGLQKSLSDP